MFTCRNMCSCSSTYADSFILLKIETSEHESRQWQHSIEFYQSIEANASVLKSTKAVENIKSENDIDAELKAFSE